VLKKRISQGQRVVWSACGQCSPWRGRRAIAAGPGRLFSWHRSRDCESIRHVFVSEPATSRLGSTGAARFRRGRPVRARSTRRQNPSPRLLL